MTQRKFQNPEKGYDRTRQAREAETMVEEDMLFGAGAKDDGMTELMATEPVKAPGWELPATFGPSPLPESQLEQSSEMRSRGPQGMTQGAGAQEATASGGEGAAASGDRITTIVKRAPGKGRSEPKRGFFSRLFGRR